MILKKFLKQDYSDFGILLLRLSFGGMIFLHGLGKLFDLISGKPGFPDPIGLGSAASLFLVTFAEFGCAILLVIGLFTRFALIPLIFTMVIVVFVHEAHLEIGDKEPPVLFMLAFTGLFITGPGKYSMDYRIFK
ncbi:MAG: DoxX family protein [Cyclobacteriaceae bacterium]|nr:DoxX family protein [Cyclobacteriaceae bacterium]